MGEKLSYKKLIEGDIPPWVRRYIKQTGKTINTFDMIRDNETILLSVSGGKDSLALALALALRRKWLPINYNLKAVMINWIEHPISDSAKDKLYEFFESLDIDFTIFDEPQYSPSFKGEFNCYLCSRNRRRILFNYAKENNLKIIALGHHLDDLVETTLINTCFRGNFSTMLPVQEFFKSTLFIIRPMIEVHEKVLIRLAENYNLPVVKPVCPYDATNIRSRLKPIISSLAHIDKLTREHVFKAHDFSQKINR
ncbi:MAG: ATP-binding protein [Sphaerochaetaceae bacterium]|nr:adenine nucleotide alpha hydrolase [Sphaerochaetaceae bacterium]MDC7238449.1 ATP-binding protein [Sphaerochaetaceae bacterium]MDC7250453.1 ATP-binding protein [Sphaerochaetaceae bacterium]